MKPMHASWQTLLLPPLLPHWKKNNSHAKERDRRISKRKQDGNE
jgi:hypothetical protein